MSTPPEQVQQPGPSVVAPPVAPPMEPPQMDSPDRFQSAVTRWTEPGPRLVASGIAAAVVGFELVKHVYLPLVENVVLPVADAAVDHPGYIGIPVAVACVATKVTTHFKPDLAHPPLNQRVARSLLTVGAVAGLVVPFADSHIGGGGSSPNSRTTTTVAVPSDSSASSIVAGPTSLPAPEALPPSSGASGVQLIIPASVTGLPCKEVLFTVAVNDSPWSVGEATQGYTDPQMTQTMSASDIYAAQTGTVALRNVHMSPGQTGGIACR